ncbi:ferric reduction oxidase 2-like, partial [Dioscorea cayenensis subsp. rotundata]|uniref:ferric-chelate reductase (NADH) n=1 Tax=Dioscorea cayennensis subsp. rotundata TaxID=55577 RepID=A0AB40D376_DIOCR
SSSSLYLRVVLSGIKLFVCIIFLGWLMIWVIMPTNTYNKEWSPKLQSATTSTYFGSQGTNILIYTFPILFIAVLGCIYLHLAKQSGHTYHGGPLSKVLQAWRRPFLLMGPLGVISAVELTFCLMFLALLVWCFSMYLNNTLSHISQNSTENGEKLWMVKLGDVSYWSGFVGHIAAAFLFFPVARMSSLLPLIGLSSEASIKYHVWIGHIVMLLFSAHGFGFIIVWAATGTLYKLLKWEAVGGSIIAGGLALVCGLIMWITAIPRIRRKIFELFYYTHHLYILFIVFYILHVGVSAFCLILPGVYLFLVDRFLRFLQSRQKIRLVSARLLPSEAVELNFSKSTGCCYSPTSTVFIKVANCSSLQWHPFTICSSSSLEPESLSIIIKREGNWTKNLYQILSSPSSPQRLDVSIEGPYGPPSLDFLRYDSLVMVSGGSGITPFISIIRELIHRSKTQRSRTPGVLLICAFKTSAELSMLNLLLPISGQVFNLSSLELRIEAYVTRDKALIPNAQNLIRTKWFKPIPSDSPISHVLGPNSWLWLGAVIATSFIAFLVLLGILTRCYIYPIDHNTDLVYNYSKKSMLNLLFICVCITASCTAAVLWNKRGNSIELKQIQSMDFPSSWSYNVDTEIESVPHESIIHSINVHFGERPDLKKMLLECKELNTGVMASGPRRLRHEVARICSSGLANNLHFESISFSW